MSERKERCETCRFWRHLLQYQCLWDEEGVLRDNYGECRRFPGTGEPMLHPVSDSSNGWCGEWQPRETEADVVPTKNPLSPEQLARLWNLTRKDWPASRIAFNIGLVRKCISAGCMSAEDVQRTLRARKGTNRWAMVAEIFDRLTAMEPRDKPE